jgi:hypothetical protein
VDMSISNARCTERCLTWARVLLPWELEPIRYGVQYLQSTYKFRPSCKPIRTLKAHQCGIQALGKGYLLGHVIVCLFTCLLQNGTSCLDGKAARPTLSTNGEEMLRVNWLTGFCCLLNIEESHVHWRVLKRDDEVESFEQAVQLQARDIYGIDFDQIVSNSLPDIRIRGS